MRRRSEAERREWFGAHPEPGTDHDRVGVDAFVVDQLDRGDLAIGTGDDATSPARIDLHAAGSQGVEFRVVHVARVVEHNGESGASAGGTARRCGAPSGG